MLIGTCQSVLSDPCLIRISEEALAELVGKRAFEKEEDRMAAIESGLYADQDVFLIDASWQRLCAPLQSHKVVACIFWRKNSPTDTTATWDKVVSIYII